MKCIKCKTELFQCDVVTDEIRYNGKCGFNFTSKTYRCPKCFKTKTKRFK